MNKEELFKQLLILEDPWALREIKLDQQGDRVDVFMDFPRRSRPIVPYVE